MPETRRGKLVVVSGPSGTGKTSICEEVLRRLPNARWSVSVTTRPRRGAEVDGREYHFVSWDEFQAMVARDEFLEHAEYLGHLYGTPRAPVEAAVAAGDVVVMEIDVQGGAQVARRVPDSIRIFVLPPDTETLRARLEGRDTESEDALGRRLAEANREISFARNSGDYQYFVINDILKDSVQRVLGIIGQEMQTG